MKTMEAIQPQEIADGILVPLDHTVLSAEVIPLAMLIADRLGVPLAAVSVLRSDSSDSEIAEQDTLASISSVLRERGAPSNTSIDVMVGDPAEEILRVCQARHCRLIAMATHARSGLIRGLLGSVTDRVIRSARVPVLVINPEQGTGEAGGDAQDERISCVVLGLDGSELAERSLASVVPIAAALGASIRLVRVISPRVGGTLGIEHSTADEHAEAVRYLERMQRVVSERVADVTIEVREGYVAEVLVGTADSIRGSILSVGTRGLSGLKRWTLGSVTDKVIRMSSRPVFVVPPKLEADSTAWAPTRGRPV